ncbi:glucan endo-1,3-beta-glucosidase 12 isoform X1 [Manihot esculenta]|uniref:glucan endo-1,3-beta-D-glucosidase n=1 Tax=Manihot esculenta TaxID=3983 RepID=A0A2C9VGU4_MANES|nr:glucan endo-1,3-beta-glucosidase 12 isoform X1 [Manihot esculenta]
MNLIKNPIWVLFLKPRKQTPLKMAEVASNCLFLFFLQLLTLCASGTQLGFSYNARGSIPASSLSRTLSFLEQNNVSGSHIRVLIADHRVLRTLSNSGVSVDLYLNETIVENFTNSRSSAVLWLKTHVITFVPHVNMKSIILKGSNDLSKLSSSLKLIHSVLSSFQFNNEVKVSVEFSLSFLENLNGKQENDLLGVLGFIKKTSSFIIVEGSTDNGVELRMGDLFLKSIIQKSTLAISLLPCNDVAVVMKVKSLIDPSLEEVAEFAAKFLKSLENTQIAGQITELYAEVSSAEDFSEKELEREHEQIFPSSRRELLKTTSHDTINPPGTVPQDNPTPTIVTVPATNPVTITPTNPASTPIPIPSITPVVVPPMNPSVNPPAPITNPVTTPAPITVPGMQPITNPVTTYPTPPVNVPVTAPVTNPISPPATTNAPAIPGQSWCVAKSGVSETALQLALDYACGMGGADCSEIQQGGSCYNPNTLQNHASFAFNSYYQKNPVATSCDFGGTATVINTNPSTGSCVFPLSSSSSSTSSLPTPTPSTINPVTTPSSPGDGTSGTVTPPSVLNSSSPVPGTTTGFGSDTPPGFNTSTSKSTTMQPSIGCISLITFFIVRIVFLDM